VPKIGQIIKTHLAYVLLYVAWYESPACWPGETGTILIASFIMKYKKELIRLLTVFIIACLLYFLLPVFPAAVRFYDRFIFYPLQSVRGFVPGALPFSMGDVFYIGLGIWLLVTFIKWIRYLFHFKSCREQLFCSVIKTARSLVVLYLLFLVGWGANYYKAPLRESWGLATAAPAAADTSQAGRYKASLERLTAFDEELTNRLNSYAPSYRHLAVKEINNRAKAYYKQYTDSRVHAYGLEVKPTFFAWFMERLGIEGYYNPITGEGQIDAGLPAFTLPFLVLHEMAHQAGIASEEDANLMAYALGTLTPDSTFRYSAYLNLWQYANARLYRRDSVTALHHEAMLNKLTRAQLDTLDQLSKKYDNDYARYSTHLYDNYLKLQDQKEGVRSYGNVVSSAWLLEQKRVKGGAGMIRVP